ncbi:MAG: hypothetical protein IPK13_00030 [Deltaproteobacteria bacterium]|nr:hypothetical protein [Deltaproteobacteria bacterium]
MPGQGPRRRLAKDAIVLDATLGAIRTSRHGIARRVLPVLAETRSSRSRFESLHLATDFLTVDAWTMLRPVR